MENKTLKIGAIALSVVATTALVATTSAYAFVGRGKFNHGKVGFKNAQNGEANAQRHNMMGSDKMSVLKTAVENNDYSALGENPKITQEQFDNMVKINQLMKDGKTDEANALRKENRGMFNKTK